MVKQTFYYRAEDEVLMGSIVDVAWNPSDKETERGTGKNIDPLFQV